MSSNCIIETIEWSILQRKCQTVSQLFQKVLPNQLHDPLLYIQIMWPGLTVQSMLIESYNGTQMTKITAATEGISIAVRLGAKPKVWLMSRVGLSMRKWKHHSTNTINSSRRNVMARREGTTHGSVLFPVIISHISATPSKLPRLSPPPVSEQESNTFININVTNTQSKKQRIGLSGQVCKTHGCHSAL